MIFGFLALFTDVCDDFLLGRCRRPPFLDAPSFDVPGTGSRLSLSWLRFTGTRPVITCPDIPIFDGVVFSCTHNDFVGPLEDFPSFIPASFPVTVLGPKPLRFTFPFLFQTLLQFELFPFSVSKDAIVSMIVHSSFFSGGRVSRFRNCLNLLFFLTLFAPSPFPKEGLLHQHAWLVLFPMTRCARWDGTLVFVCAFLVQMARDLISCARPLPS